MSIKKQEQRINELVERSLGGLSDLVDGNTVIGKPIFTASGCQIIPVSRVTMGYLSGGSDIGECKVIKEVETVPFAGGSGAVVSVKPAGFLLDDGTTCRYVRAGDDPLDNLLEKATDFLKGIQHADAD